MTTLNIFALKLNCANVGVLPDSAMVCRPPAATEVILTPGPKLTQQGDATNASSPEVELSVSCLADVVFLLFKISSPVFLLSERGNAGAVTSEP